MDEEGGEDPFEAGTVLGGDPDEDDERGEGTGEEVIRIGDDVRHDEDILDEEDEQSDDEDGDDGEDSDLGSRR